MKVKHAGGWKNGRLRFKHPTQGWARPDRQFVKAGGVWRRSYDDPNAVVENFESGNIFTQGTMSVTRQAASAFSGGYGLYAYTTHDTLRTKLTSDALADLTGIYRYEALIRMVPNEWGNNLAGIAFCGQGVDPAGVYVALIDSRNQPGAFSTMGLQLRYGSGWNDVMKGEMLALVREQWYQMVVTHNQVTGLIKIAIEDLGGTVLGTLTHTDTRLKGGRFGVFTVGGNDFDNVSRELIS